MNFPLLRTLAATLALAASCAACGTAGAQSNSPQSCAAGGEPMVVGYFDHTAAWYRRQAKIKPNQMAAVAWQPPAQGGIVVLYSDVSSVKTEEDGAPADVAEIRKRMQEREGDIEGYLNAARKKRIGVRIQVPPDIVEHWAAEPENRELLGEFVKRWAGHPAASGFYLFDEPELSDIPAATLAEVAGVVRKHAPKAVLTISVASSAVGEDKPNLRAYSNAKPRIFDEILVNRYPVYRAYGAASAKGGTGMSGKLGLQADKAGRENLMDNEFQNLADYYESLVAATKVPGLAGRPVYAAFQAYGLRDDCDGPQCKATRERKARRSPTWNELLYMYSSVWMSGLDGAVLYSRYFSLYDGALRKRLDNLEALMGPVFGTLPGCGSDVTVNATTARRKSAPGATANVMARLAAAPDAKSPGFLVVLHHSANRESVRVRLDDAPGVTRAEELRFNAQGAALEPVRHAVEGGKGNGSRALLLQLDGVGVSLYRLAYD